MYDFKEGREKYKIDGLVFWCRYLTPTRKKYLKIAYDFHKKNHLNKVKINRILFTFDFENKKILIDMKGDKTQLLFLE